MRPGGSRRPRIILGTVAYLLPLQVDPLHPTRLGRRRRVLEPLQCAPARRGQCALALHLKASLGAAIIHEIAAL